MKRDLLYQRWKTHRLARRLLQYGGYVDCGCAGGKHDRKSTICAQADFERAARELVRRLEANQ